MYVHFHAYTSCVSYAKFVSIMETMTDECNSFSGDEEYIYDVCMYVYDIYIYIYIYIYIQDMDLGI